MPVVVKPHNRRLTQLKIALSKKARQSRLNRIHKIRLLQVMPSHNPILLHRQTQEVRPAHLFLLDASSDQFRFALTRALQNDLETAEKAFIEFSELYPNMNALPMRYSGWAGCTYSGNRKISNDFSKFNALYSNRSALPDTTLRIVNLL